MNDRYEDAGGLQVTKKKQARVIQATRTREEQEREKQGQLPPMQIDPRFSTPQQAPQEEPVGDLAVRQELERRMELTGKNEDKTLKTLVNHQRQTRGSGSGIVNLAEKRWLKSGLRRLDEMNNDMRHIPARTVLKEAEGEEALGSAYEGQLSRQERGRLSSIDTDTPLFDRQKNAARISRAEQEHAVESRRLLDQVTSQGEGLEEDSMTMACLAQFLRRDQQDRNRTLAEHFRGFKKQLPNGRADAEDVTQALRSVTRILFGCDISGLHLESDEEVAANAKTLEQLSGMIAAYDHLVSENPQFFAGLDKSELAQIQEKLALLRSIAAYYYMRKQLLEDEYYQVHGPAELSMELAEEPEDETERAAWEEKRRVAERLIGARVLGNQMLTINGLPPQLSVLGGELNLMSETSRQLLAKAQEDATPEGQRELVEQAFRTSSYFAINRQ